MRRRIGAEVKFDVVQVEVNARDLGGGVAELVVRAVGDDESLDGIILLSQFAADGPHVAEHLPHGLISRLPALQLDHEPAVIRLVPGQQVDEAHTHGVLKAASG